MNSATTPLPRIAFAAFEIAIDLWCDFEAKQLLRENWRRLLRWQLHQTTLQTPKK
jgi:hypothetical protein